MTAIVKTLKFFENRRKKALKNGYKKPKVILVDIDGTIVKPKVKMYSMAEERLGKKTIAQLEKSQIRPLRRQMIQRKISFEKYLIELSKIDIKLGEYLKDYKDYFYGLAKKNLLNVPLIKALGNLCKKDQVKVVFVTSNLKIFGEIISNEALKAVGLKGKFNGAVGAEYLFKSRKAIRVKSLISHHNATCEGVKFFTKETTIKNFFRKNRIKVDKDEVVVISDADTALMQYYGLGGLVYYPLSELSSQFKEIEYIMNARKGLYDFRVDYSKGKDLEIAQKKWEIILGDPNMIKYSEEELRKILKAKRKNE